MTSINAAWAWLRAKLKGWKTVAFNALVLLPPVFDALGAVDLKATIGPEWFTYYTIFAAVVNLILRQYTSTPVGKS